MDEVYDINGHSIEFEALHTGDLMLKIFKSSNLKVPVIEMRFDPESANQIWSIIQEKGFGDDIKPEDL